MYIQCNSTHPLTRWNLMISDNICGPGGYYVKWDISDEERQASYRFHFNVEYKTTEQTPQIKKPNQRKTWRFRE